MQLLRPLLRSGQGLGRGRAATLSRCPPLCTIPISRYLCRTQHSNNGPHKEYFQVPGQEPRPDLTPYVREYQQQSQLQPLQGLPSSTNKAQVQNAADQATPPKAKGWLRIPRFTRSLLWFVLFFQLGVTAGTAVVTWEYLSPPFEPGSPEEQELVEDILETLEEHPMVQDLRDNEWIEVEAFTPDLQHGAKGRNLVHHVLGGNNTQGIFMKVFHHPAQEFTMMVFFFGFGVEGWPDVIHGGMIATLLQEGLGKHIAYYYPGHNTTADMRTNIDYKKPCKPGDIYAVLVAPSGNKAITAGNVHLTELQMTSLLVQLVGAPVVNTEFDLASNTETHTVGIPAQKGQQPTHATCQAAVKIIPKQVAHGGKAFEIGQQDNDAFGRALEYLKSRPEFKNTQPSPSPKPSIDEEETDKD